MWFNSIARRVARVIKQRVQEAQREHNERRLALEQEKQRKIEEHAEEMVNRIIGR